MTPADSGVSVDAVIYGFQLVFAGGFVATAAALGVNLVRRILAA